MSSVSEYESTGITLTKKDLLSWDPKDRTIKIKRSKIRRFTLQIRGFLHNLYQRLR